MCDACIDNNDDTCTMLFTLVHFNMHLNSKHEIALYPQQQCWSTLGNIR